MSKSKNRKSVKIDIRPEYDWVKKKVNVKPLVYKPSFNFAKVIQEEINKIVDSDRTFLGNTNTLSMMRPDLTRTRRSYTSSSPSLTVSGQTHTLQSLFLKANEIKNKSSEDLKKLKNLDTSDPIFKSMIIQKSVLDRMINSYIEKINFLRARQGRYTEADKNEVALLPTKIQSIEVEYSKLKDMMKEHEGIDIPLEERRKREVEYLYNKLLDMNRILDPNSSVKKLDAEMIQRGPEVDQLMNQINTPELSQPLIAKISSMLDSFNKDYTEIKRELEVLQKNLLDQSEKAFIGKENILLKASVSAFKDVVNDILNRLNTIKAEQDSIMLKIVSREVNAKEIVKFNINLEDIKLLRDEVIETEREIEKEVKRSVARKVQKGTEDISLNPNYISIIEIYDISNDMIEKISTDLLWLNSKKKGGTKYGSTVIRKRDGTRITETDLVRIYGKYPLVLYKEIIGEELIFNPKNALEHLVDPFNRGKDPKSVLKENGLFVQLPNTISELLNSIITFYIRYKIAYKEMIDNINHIKTNAFPLASVAQNIASFIGNNIAKINENKSTADILREIYLTICRPIIDILRKGVKAPKEIIKGIYDDGIDRFVARGLLTINEINTNKIIINNYDKNRDKMISIFVDIEEVPSYGDLPTADEEEEKKIVELENNISELMKEIEELKQIDRSAEIRGEPSPVPTEELNQIKNELEDHTKQLLIMKYERLDDKLSDFTQLDSGSYGLQEIIARPLHIERDEINDKYRALFGFNLSDIVPIKNRKYEILATVDKIARVEADKAKRAAEKEKEAAEREARINEYNARKKAEEEAKEREAKEREESSIFDEDSDEQLMQELTDGKYRSKGSLDVNLGFTGSKSSATKSRSKTKKKPKSKSKTKRR